ncbi:hypothetical protein C5167_035922 [Papaver somniferum]|nr:hypothetical protein C5167_035922 [Papaver somniferum]
MILLDEYGEQIHAVLSKDHYRKHITKMEEGNLVTITHFSISEVKGKWRPVPGNSILCFNNHTQVTVDTMDTMDNRKIPLHKFVLTDLNELNRRYGNGISILEYTGQPSKHSQIKREILLHTEISSARVTLWGDAFRQIGEEYLEDTDKYVVLIITSTLVEKFNNAYCLSTTMETKIYVDLSLPEVENLRDRYGLYLGVLLINCERKQQKPIEEMLFHNRMPLGEGCGLIHHEENLEMTFTSKGKIIGVVPNSTWYYLACLDCNSMEKANLSGREWGAPCNCKIKRHVPSYKLELRIQEESGTGTGTFAIIGSVADTLFDDNERVSAFMRFNALTGKVFTNQRQYITYFANL